jgi:murein L,D-transpeptidase YcbB/YkuD
MCILNRVLWFALAGSLLAGCDRFKKEPQRSETGGEVDDSFEPAKVESVKGVAIAEIRSTVSSRLAAAAPKPIGASEWGHTKRLYAQFGGNPIWLDSDGLRERRTKTLMTALLNADSDALTLDNYPLDELNRLLSTLLKAKHPTAKLLGDLDVALTATYVALGEDLLTGQVDPKSVSQDWHIKPTPAQVDSALARFLGDRRFDVSMTQMRPQNEEYAALQKQLAHYRTIIGNGGWKDVPAGKSLKAGDKAPAERLTALRNRLRAEGYSVVPSEARDPRVARRSQDSTSPLGGPSLRSGFSVFDRTLAGAVAQFQREHGIVVDSALGPETLQSLNLPATYRLGQIAGNMERYRWMPRALGDRYVIVNVPAFRLEAFDNQKEVMQMKVIVGAEYEDRNTPAFADSMRFVVFRPYWNATDGIMAKELWPKAQADPTYLERNNYEVVAEGGKQRIRQRPGLGNALGLVKFMFPNSFSIYMHDTPEHQLFAEDIRAFSHGCIRLEHPDQMAEWVLGWPADRVKAQMETGPDDHRVTLKEGIPVYIVYFTTFMRDGRLWFGNDLYSRDAALVDAVKTGAQPTPKALAAVRLLRELAED